MPITVEVAPGELIDKLSILKIKQQKIDDAAKLANVGREMAKLAPQADALIAGAPKVAEFLGELTEINTALWEIEDNIRRCEARQDFGDRFVELARAVYVTNDRRAAVKRAINELLDSDIMEEKHYVDYAAGS